MIEVSPEVIVVSNRDTLRVREFTCRTLCLLVKVDIPCPDKDEAGEVPRAQILSDRSFFQGSLPGSLDGDRIIL